MIQETKVSNLIRLKELLETVKGANIRIKAVLIACAKSKSEVLNR